VARELVWSDDDPDDKQLLRLLVMGAPKSGKTVTCVGTCPQPSYVINCDQGKALNHVKIHYPKARFVRDPYPVHDIDAMERALYSARKMAKAGEIRTVVLDTLSGFSKKLILELEEASKNGAGESNGLKYYPAYTRYIIQLCSRICEIPCHVIVNTHWIDLTKENGDGVEKVGEGKVPLLETEKASKSVGGEFSDIVMLERPKNVGRRFVLGRDGAQWGPGGRNLKDGASPVRANIITLMRTMGLLPPKKKVAHGA
jgi:AAA domain